MSTSSSTKDLSSPPLIFLIDDVVQNLQVLSEALRQEGFRISGAGSGSAALRILQQVKPDLILCDIMMPEMDGYEVTLKLKANPATQDIPVIFLTARTESEDILKGFQVGGVDYITKPFNTRELLARVKTHLELKQARDTILENSKRLSALNQEKDQILNIAAHDLKNPLASIMLMAEMMQVRQGQLSPAKLLEYAQHIYQDSERMSLIITNLLDVNKIESGMISAQKKECALSDIISRLQKEYQLKADAKQIQLNIIQPENETKIFTDPLLLFQLLDNLLSNAIKFSESGKQVFLRIQPETTAIKFEIEDQGPGFTAEDQELMFQKFARLSAHPTANENSTGLGLAIVKRLSELLDIQLTYQSQTGQGTQFSIYLPQESTVVN